MKYCLAPARPKPVIYDVRVERERGLFSFSPVGEIIFKKKLNIADFFVVNSKVSPKRPSGGHSQPMLTLLMEDRKSTRLNSSHSQQSRMPSSA